MIIIQRLLVPLLVLCAFAPLKAQDYAPQGGNFSFGVRNTFSLFSDGDPHGFGYGAGAHVRLQIIDRVNTEWFGDILTSSILNKAHRTDYHIGWSVMYYIINPRGFTRKFTPYVVAGHCFDLARIKINGPGGALGSRVTAAVQAGFGCHYNITPKFDISLCAQYMIHLGKEVDAEEDPDGSMEIVTHKNAGWEGHLLISLSANYKIAQLWKPKQKKVKAL
ncbi:MAG TPA: hypothetical protein VG603_08205 [Chitinophagales bacterium]|nr:hypothetical protein [Chitinophagales bacterium]